LSDKIRTLY